jgi:hypothetical protein
MNYLTVCPAALVFLVFKTTFLAAIIPAFTF